MLKQFFIEMDTPGRGLIDLTNQVREFIGSLDVDAGLCHLFLHHTSASLVVCENADQLVMQDLECFMSRLIPDGDPMCSHVDEGPDDMPSHIRTILTQSTLCVPITDGKLALGRWQGLYLWEHRLKPHHRKVTVTIQA